jgi:hypothetical protein
VTLSVRTILIGLGLAFTAYLAGRGLGSAASADQPFVVVGTVALYLLTAWLCLFWEVKPSPRFPENLDQHGWLRGPRPLPPIAGVLAVAVAALAPSTTALGVGEEFRSTPFATWYIGGIGALMTVVMVRRRTLFAWAGTVILAVSSMLWLGVIEALTLGLVGSVLWVSAAQLMLLSLDRAANDTARLEQLQRAASAWQAAQTGRERERRIQVKRALAIAGPILARAIMTGGGLDEYERREAKLAEGQLRDELRAPRLLDDDVRAALYAARRRGATVTVLDEGGLERVGDGDLAEIRNELARTIEAAQSDRIYIRTSPDDRVAVTVVGRKTGDTMVSDDESVDLFAEIPHPVGE